MIAVVTGASGFIGRNLVGRLLSEGHEVRCVSRPTGRVPPAGASQFQIDFGDPASWSGSRAFERADIVYHLAGATRARSQAAFDQANVVPTRHLLNALAAIGSGARLVYVSSQAAAGPATALERPVVETDAPRPVEAYGRSKLQAERVVQQYADDLPVTIVRPCSVFGPLDRDFLRLFQMARRGVAVYPGTERQWLSLVYVEDLVDALIAVASAADAAGHTYFVASDTPVQWRTLGEEIAAVVRRPVSHINIPGTLIRAASRLGDALALVTRDTPLLNSNKAALTRDPYWICGNERAKKGLGWQPKRSLPDALRDTYLWYEQSGWTGGGSRSTLVVA